MFCGTSVRRNEWAWLRQILFHKRGHRKGLNKFGVGLKNRQIDGKYQTQFTIGQVLFLSTEQQLHEYNCYM